MGPTMISCLKKRLTSLMCLLLPPAVPYFNPPSSVGQALAAATAVGSAPARASPSPDLPFFSGASLALLWHSSKFRQLMYRHFLRYSIIYRFTVENNVGIIHNLLCSSLLSTPAALAFVQPDHAAPGESSHFVSPHPTQPTLLPPSSSPLLRT